MKNILSVLNVTFVVICTHNAYYNFSNGLVGLGLFFAFAAMFNLYAVINANT